MKKYLRYVAGGLFAAALLILLFAPLIDVAVMELSLADVMKLGSGIGSSNAWGGFEDVLREYMKPYFFVILFLILLVIASVLGCVLLSWRSAYVAALAGVAATNIVTVISVWTLYSKTKELRQGLSFFGMEGLIRLHKGPIILWFLLCAGILAISVWGIIQAAKMPERERVRDILPESFNGRKNPWEDHRDLTAQVGREDYLNRINELEQEKQRREMFQEIVHEKQEEKRQQERMAHFHGALKGLEGIYDKKIYGLEEKLPVYFVRDGEQVFVSEKKEEDTLAEVYYISEYGEYCLTPKKRRACILESGQPLGPDRHYYLKRGTRIGVNGLSFLLA